MAATRAARLTPTRTAEVKSAARTIEILELLAVEPRPLTLSELADRLHIPLSSLHQLLQTLVAREWLSASEHAATYAIGVRALVAGMSFIDRDPIVQATRPWLNELLHDLGETVHLARLNGSRVIYLASRESEHQLRTASRVGQTVPAHATALGKVMLSALTDEELQRALVPPLEQLTVHTITDPDTLIQQIAEARKTGWAREREEITPGSGCFAVLIPGVVGPYAISCSVPVTRLDEQRGETILNALLGAAVAIGRSVRPSARP